MRPDDIDGSIALFFISHKFCCGAGWHLATIFQKCYHIHMKWGEVEEKYLARFPSKTRDYLSGMSEEDKESFSGGLYADFADVPVYRGLIKKGIIQEADFLGNVEQAEFLGKPVRKNLIGPAAYGVSVNESLAELIKSTRFPNKSLPVMGIAKGVMRSVCGLSDFRAGKPHHNWYIFENMRAKAMEEFEILEEPMPAQGVMK